MAEVDEKVMEFVEEILQRTPDIPLEELFSKVKRVHPSMEALSRRQFNARYPLQVKRRKAQSVRVRNRGKTKGAPPRTAPSRRGSRRASETSRDGVRQIFLQFATDIAGAEERKELVRVLADVDRYVDQAMKRMG